MFDPTKQSPEPASLASEGHFPMQTPTCAASHPSAQRPAGNSAGVTAPTGKPALDIPEQKHCPLEVLPPIYRNAVIEACRKSHMPHGMGVLVLLAAVSAVLGQGITACYPDEDFAFAPNLLTLLGTKSGGGKGKLYKLLLLPWDKIKAKLADDFDTLSQELIGEKEDLEAEVAAVRKNKSGTSTPAERRAFGAKITRIKVIQAVIDMPIPVVSTTDMTEAGGTMALAAGQAYFKAQGYEHPETGASLALFNSDAKDALAWMTPMELGRGKTKAQDSVMLRGYSREPIESTRATKYLGNVTSPCVSALLLVTPAKLQEFVGNREILEDGLLGRFLIYLHNDKRSEWLPSPRMDPRVMQSYERAMTELCNAFRLTRYPVCVEFAVDAQEAIREYSNWHTRRNWSDTADIEALTVRWAEAAGKIATQLHVMELGPAKSKRQKISLANAKKAIQLMRFYDEHILGIVAEGRAKKTADVDGKLLDALKKHARTGLKLGLAYRDGIGNTPGEGRAILQAAATKGEASILYTWNNHQETALAFAPDSGEYKAALRRHQAVVSKRLANGQPTLHSQDPVHKKAEQTSQTEAPKYALDFSYLPPVQQEMELPAAGYTCNNHAAAPACPPPISEE